MNGRAAPLPHLTDLGVVIAVLAGATGLFGCSAFLIGHHLLGLTLAGGAALTLAALLASPTTAARRGCERDNA